MFKNFFQNIYTSCVKKIFRLWYGVINVEQILRPKLNIIIVIDTRHAVTNTERWEKFALYDLSSVRNSVKS